MNFADVNILVYAHRSEVPRHDEYREWLDQARRGDEPLALADQVLAGFLRIVTHPRIFIDPTPSSIALSYARALRESPAALPITPGPRTWSLFEDLVERVEARGNLIPDALIAAMALEQGATLITTDRGFARFPRVRWRHPLD